MKKCPKKEIAIGMSNFNHSIEEGFEAAIKKASCFGRHAGWNFNGRVWWDDGFHEEVWVDREPVEIISAETLEELMEQVSNRYGWE